MDAYSLKVHKEWIERESKFSPDKRSKGYRKL